MRIAFICVICFIFSLEARAENAEAAFNEICGRMIRTSLRFPPDAFKSVITRPSGETTEELLTFLNSSGLWSKFTFMEKCEFTALSLLYCNIEGGDATLFSIMLGSDGPKIGAEIMLLKDDTLKDRLGLTAEAIDSFRCKVRNITGFR